MGSKTGIAWADCTWNPWQGCNWVSPGCDNCYMFREKYRYGQEPDKVVRSAPATFNMPASQTRMPPGSRVFVCSWSDFFHPVADPWRVEAWAWMKARTDCTFMIVTKRAGRIAACLPADWGTGYPNVWLLVTAENQQAADERIPLLLSVPAIIHGVSVEPQLEDIDLAPYLPPLKGETRVGACLRWIIVGGESGPALPKKTIRPFHVNWARGFVAEARARQNVVVFIKQFGADVRSDPSERWPAETKWFVDGVNRVGLKHPAGADPQEWPEDLRWQLFPRKREIKVDAPASVG